MKQHTVADLGMQGIAPQRMRLKQRCYLLSFTNPAIDSLVVTGYCRMQAAIR